MKRALTVIKALRVGEALPFSGVALLGGMLAQPAKLTRISSALVAAMAGVFCLALFAFVFNDLQDREADQRSGAKPARPLVSGLFSARFMWVLLFSVATAGLLALAIWTNRRVFWAGLVTIILSIAYSMKPVSLKSVPVLSSLIHVTEGTLACVVGWWAVGAANWTSVVVGCYFGLVFAAGHLHHEAADLFADRRSGTRTHAVLFGARTTLLAGLALWTLSAILFSALAFCVLNRQYLGWIQLAMFAAYLWGRAFILRGRNDPAAIKHLQAFYRLVFLSGGLIMVIVMTLLEAAK